MKTANAIDLNVEQKAKLDQFKAYVIGHKHLTDAMQKSIDAICRNTGPRVVSVTGPTGVGKSTLAERLTDKLQTIHADEVDQDKSCIPVTRLNAIPPHTKLFDWKDFYIRLLTAHGDVMLDRKLAIPQQGELFRVGMTATGRERSSPEALRRSVESSLCHRRTKTLIIDEAHHILMVNNPIKLEYQFEILKSLTIETNTTIVLVGTYRLLDIREHSGQLVRRSEIIHLPRYNTKDPQDQQVFTNFAHSLVQKLPIKPAVGFNELMDFFYLKTGGCIGILKDWLARCLEIVLHAGKDTFDLDDLKACCLDNKGLCTIVEEAKAGEARLKDVSDAELRRLLYEEEIPSPSPLPFPPSRRRRMRVGERLPTRDPVGGGHHVAQTH